MSAVTCPAGLTVYRAESWLPKVGRPEWLGRVSFNARLRRARKALRDQGCEKIILYLWRPEFAPALSSIKYDFSCYHIVDEYSFSSVEVPVQFPEVELARKVNQVFIHSPGLLERLGSFNPNTAYIPNGVDYGRFSTPVPEPWDLAPIPRPRIGYNGWLKLHLDWVLLDTLSARHREWSFVFVGPVMHSSILPVVERLSHRSNVHFLGAKSADELTTYPQHFDVSIMPYALSDYSAKFIYPLKLHEYLAGGSPVVGTRLRSLERFASVVRLAVSPDEWTSAITASLTSESKSPASRAIRQAIAKEHDWDRLVGRIARVLASGVQRHEAGRLNSNPLQI
jgi:glycosyltransferase involved in cell wall biosynthesis